MQEANPLEVSNLTDDSKLLEALGKSREKTLPAPKVIATKSEHIVIHRIETPAKMRGFLGRSSTPDTAPVDEELDDMSNDSKFMRHSASEATIRVDDFKNASFHKLIRSIGGNLALTKVEVFRLRHVTNKRARSREQMTLFFAAIRSLPNLNQLILNSFHIRDLELIGSFVKGHKTLEKIHVHVTSGTVNQLFLGILSQAPALREVSLDVHSSFPLDILLASNTIRRVAVPSETFRFEERHFVGLMKALAKNKRLRILDLKPKLAPSDVTLLCFGVRDNKRLRVLRFSFLASASEAGPSLLHLCEALAKNSSLTAVENYYSKLLNVTQQDCYHMLKILERNDTLKTFEVFDDDKIEQEFNADAPSAWENFFLAKLMCDADNLLSRTAFRCFRPWDDDMRCSTFRTSQESTFKDNSPSVAEASRRFKQQR